MCYSFFWGITYTALGSPIVWQQTISGKGDSLIALCESIVIPTLMAKGLHGKERRKPLPLLHMTLSVIGVAGESKKFEGAAKLFRMESRWNPPLLAREPGKPY